MASKEASASEKLDFIREVQVRFRRLPEWRVCKRAASDVARVAFKDIFPAVYHCNWSKAVIKSAIEQALPVESFDTASLSKLNFVFGRGIESHYSALESIANG